MPIDQILRRQPRTPGDTGDLETLLTREWLVTNALGGYSSATVPGVVTRRYHGVLVAALPNPIGRMVMLNHLGERVSTPDGAREVLSGEERAGGRLDVPATRALTEFRLEAGLPVWEFRVGEAVIEKRVVMPHEQNTVYVSYRLLSGAASATLELRPGVHFRGYEAPVDTPVRDDYRCVVTDGHLVVTGPPELPPLRLKVYGQGTSFAPGGEETGEVLYRVESNRGYVSQGARWSPGTFTVEMAPGVPAVLVASSESYDVMTALTPAAAEAAERERRRRLLEAAPAALRDGVAAELVLAADQFVIRPAGRQADTARATAVGDAIRTVIAGYHWFTDWGRDTMISLEGLTLTTGRHREGGAILRAFAQHVRDGLIPNMFPDGSDQGLYHTADATLWFFHALDRFAAVTGNELLVRDLLPTLVDIVAHHRAGTRFGIGMDAADGLLRQGQEGYQLTWMDAKVDDWVVTPRRGKAVEINALWYNALCLLEGWLREAGRAAEADDLGALAARVRASFNRRFWNERAGYLNDVLDGPNGDSDDCRPNQLLAISLHHPVLDESRWAAVVAVCERRLLTPVGLRSLAPGHPDYKPRYDGDLRARDAAYHQGTVWGWLIGPFVDAWLRVHPDDREGARRLLDGLAAHLDDFGVGSLAEIFDAEPPYTPRGCVAQAWSVAEELRCWAKTARE